MVQHHRIYPSFIFLSFHKMNFLSFEKISFIAGLTFADKGESLMHEREREREREKGL